METFLGNVAESLWRQYGEDISSLRILVPNSRSKLFFADELSRLIDRPLWQPRFVSVDDLMYEIAGVSPADRVRAVVELYKAYSEFHSEDFDSFYFWGEMLLADFDQIDKYLVDARRLFANLNDLRELEAGISYMDEGQREAVRRFWASFGDGDERSGEKRSFLTVWNTLFRIYISFRERLAASGTAYTGMAHRAAAAKLSEGEPLPDGARYAVIGFNALSGCEKALFNRLRDSGRADFFWDYDDYYISHPEQEAGLLMRGNVKSYPPPEWFANDTDNFRKPKNICAVAVPSDSLQCKYAAEFLEARLGEQGTVGKETAIVLTDENLLVPLLYSIPGGVQDINVTMGYPLRQTLAYSFVERLFKLQGRARRRDGAAEFHHADATGLLSHPFVVGADGANAAALKADIIEKSRVYVPESLFRTGAEIERIFAAQKSWKDIAGYVTGIISAVAARQEDDRTKEYFGVIADTLRKLSNSLDGCGIELTIPVVSSLARRMLQNISIPFSGEPLHGLQVMGILETRNIDFRNVMVMSADDANFPGNTAAASSFIPYNLRLAYGLPTPQQHDAVYAYYFYRLLQRAENVDIVYCSGNDSDNSGEPSRYIHQLDYESPHELKKREVGLDVNFAGDEPITVEKASPVMSQLEKFLDGGRRSLSPSAFNAWLDCPLKFYFRSVAGLKPEDTVAEEVDMPMFGTILHRAMELLYEPLIGADDPRPTIKALMGSRAVGEAVDRAISEVCFDGGDAGSYEGGLLTVRDTVIKYIDKSLLPFDAAGERFTILALEKELTGVFGFEAAARPHTVRFYGKADRVDSVGGGRVRVVDYKTGKAHRTFKSLPDIFENPRPETHAVMQTFLYSMMAARMQAKGELPGTDAFPALYYVREMNREGYSPLPEDRERKSAVTGYAEYRGDMEAMLSEKLSELFDPGVPFSQCESAKPCETCDFNPLCRRA